MATTWMPLPIEAGNLHRWFDTPRMSYGYSNDTDRDTLQL
jgi:hypothetical protein